MPIQKNQLQKQTRSSNNTPAVVRLPVHLHGEQFVSFHAEEQPDDVIQRQNDTRLTAWMQFNDQQRTLGSSLGADVTYVDFPAQFRWTGRAWSPRVRQGTAAVGRMYFVSPRDPERFYLRLLLHHVVGATCFADVRTADGIEYDSYRQACAARGLLQDDEEWDECLREASVVHMPVQLRSLFATILIFNSPSNPGRLLEKYANDMAEDKLRETLARYGIDRSDEIPSGDDLREAALWDVQVILQQHNLCVQVYGLPPPRLGTEVVRS